MDHVLLNFLDRPPRLLIFTYDQVTGFIGSFLLMTLLFNLPEMGIVLGLLWVLLLPSFKKRIGLSSWSRLSYWYLPSSHKIPSYIRTWLGCMGILFLSNCGFLGIYDQSFECPPQDGLKCTSTSRVNRITDSILGTEEGSLEVCKKC